MRAAKLTNRWISGCWWERDVSPDEHVVRTKHGLLKCRSVRRKPPGEQWSRRETVEARGTKWNFDAEMDSGISGPPVASRPHEWMPTATAQGEIPTVPPLALPPEDHVPEMRGQGVHAKALRIRAFWSEIGRTPGCLACDTPSMVVSETATIPRFASGPRHLDTTCSHECVTFPDPRVEIHWIPSRRGQKTTSVTDNENLADRMDEDNFRRRPATSHQLEPVDDENVSKKARVARNVLHIRGEDNVKFDVNEEA